MLNNITIILSILITFFFVSCEQKKKDNTAVAAAAFLLTRSSSATGGGCTSGPTTTISNTALGSTAASATQYSVSGCDSATLTNLGFSNQNIATGLIGTSTSSRLASSGDLYSGSDVNIEVTFKLDNASGYLEVIGQGSGTAATIDGSAIRINAASTQARGGGSTTLSTITGQSTAVGQLVTYCLDFHNESPNLHAVFWPTACNAVSTADRNSYTGREQSIASTFPGKRVGFILNNATLTSFTIRTRLGIALNLLQP